MIDLAPRCSKCSKKIDVNDIKTLPDGKHLCASCYENKVSSKEPKYKKIFGRKSSSTKQPVREDVSKQENVDTPDKKIPDTILSKKEYICNECGYRFVRNADFVVSVCPYCGKNDVQRYIAPSTNNLV
ncbi:MAG: hypothetical protein ACQESC_02315 [Nanobdellota archaeon]